MKRIKALNGYTIMEYTKRDAAAGHEIGEYAIFFSSDIRDFGVSGSDPEYEDIDGLNVAMELCAGNYAKAKEIAEEYSTCAEYSEIDEIEKALDAGIDPEEIREKIENGEEISAPEPEIDAAKMRRFLTRKLMPRF